MKRYSFFLSFFLLSNLFAQNFHFGQDEYFPYDGLSVNAANLAVNDIKSSLNSYVNWQHFNKEKSYFKVKYASTYVDAEKQTSSTEIDVSAVMQTGCTTDSGDAIYIILNNPSDTITYHLKYFHLGLDEQSGPEVISNILWNWTNIGVRKGRNGKIKVLDIETSDNLREIIFSKNNGNWATKNTLLAYKEFAINMISKEKNKPISQSKASAKTKYQAATYVNVPESAKAQTICDMNLSRILD